MREEIEIFVEVLDDTIELPTYAHNDDSGMDIRASKDVIIAEGETVIISTGLKVAIPDGFEIQVRPRSGISLKTPLRVSNTPGTIDAGFRDEIGVIMTNTSIHKAEKLFSLDSKGNQQGTYLISKGDRIAQIVLQRVPKIKFTKVDSVKDIGIDRNGGFGSSGLK